VVPRADKDTVDDAAWNEAVAREAVIRRLAALDGSPRSAFCRACHELRLKRTRLYELIRAYREHPVTSSLLLRPAGPRRGSRRLSVTFRLLEGGARPVCRWCGLMVADQGGEDARPEDPALVGMALAAQQEITVRVNQAASERAGIEMSLAALWAPLDHPAAARPVLALWFGGAGWRCPSEVRHGVGAGAPLGQLPVRWRLVTLLALSEVFGLDPRRDGVLPPVAAHLVRRAGAAAGPRPASSGQGSVADARRPIICGWHGRFWRIRAGSRRNICRSASGRVFAPA
jgi:hypothetical protein